MENDDCGSIGHCVIGGSHKLVSKLQCKESYDTGTSLILPVHTATIRGTLLVNAWKQHIYHPSGPNLGVDRYLPIVFSSSTGVILVEV